MRRAIGFVIVLYALSHMFGQATSDLAAAASATFKLVETAAVVGQHSLTKQ